MSAALESYRGLLYEIRDLSRGGAVYASNFIGNNTDGPFSFAMFSVIERNADSILKLFDIIEYSAAWEIIEGELNTRLINSTPFIGHGSAAKKGRER